MLTFVREMYIRYLLSKVFMGYVARVSKIKCKSVRVVLTCFVKHAHFTVVEHDFRIVADIACVESFSVYFIKKMEKQICMYEEH